MEQGFLFMSNASAGIQININLTKGVGDTFGNYMLHGIEEVQLPEMISWWPQAVGWKILLVFALLWLGRRIAQAISNWRGDYYRRMALKQLAQIEAASTNSPHALRQLAVLLKTTALQAYPRTEVAHLSGQAWLSMLDSKWDEATFSTVIGERLLAINYQSEQVWHFEPAQIEEVIDTIRRWIRKHQRAESAAHYA